MGPRAPCVRVERWLATMKLGTLVMTSCVMLSTLFAGGCSRHRQEAAKLAIEGDKAVKVDVEGAINKYEQATKLDPTSHRIFHKLAMAYRKKDEWDKVASTMSRAAQLAPTFANYWFERGYALEQQAKKKTISYEEAKEPYLKCIEVDPNYADCYHQVANAYLWTDDEQKALDYYTKAIQHDPGQIYYYSALGDLYIRLGYVNEAEQVLKEGKNAAKPGDKYLFGVHSLLAQVQQERGNMLEMVAELEAAKAVAPAEGSEAVQILWSLGSTYAKLDPPRKQEAVQMLKGFNSRACKGSKAAMFKTECESAQRLVADLGGTIQ